MGSIIGLAVTILSNHKFDGDSDISEGSESSNYSRALRQIVASRFFSRRRENLGFPGLRRCSHKDRSSFRYVSRVINSLLRQRVSTGTRIPGITSHGRHELFARVGCELQMPRLSARRFGFDRENST